MIQPRNLISTQVWCESVQGAAGFGAARGSPLSRVLPVDADRSIAGLLPVSQQQLEGDQDYVVLVTKQGLVKGRRSRPIET